MILDAIRKKRESAGPLNGDKSSRSMVKALSWRLLGTLDTIVISWLVTGNLQFAYTIGSVELITKMFLYFIHERVWDKIKWGRK